MADRIQLRRDTAANWTKYNPILLEGEPGIELDTDQWKLGDGIHNWNALPYRGMPCVQQRGTSTTTPMSQKAVSDEFNAIDEYIKGYLTTTFFQGNINATTGKFSSMNMRVTNETALNEGEDIYVTCSGDVRMNSATKYTANTSPINGGVQNTDWKDIPFASGESKTNKTFKFDSAFPNLYVTFCRISDSTQPITLEEVADNVVFCKATSLQGQVRKNTKDIDVLKPLVNDLQSDYNQLNTKEAALEKRVENTEKRIFKLYGDFVNGSLRYGELISAPYRIAGLAKETFDEDIVLKPKTGFKFGIHTFVNDVFDADSGWIMSEYTIPAGTVFRITIAKIAEQTSVAANIAEFLDGVYCTTSLQGQVEKNADNITTLQSDVTTLQSDVTKLNGKLSISYFQGNINSTGKISPNVGTRVTTNLINKSVKVVCKGDVQMNIAHAYKINELNSDFIEIRHVYHKTTDFINTDEEYSYLNITFDRVSDNTLPITPEEVAANVEIVSLDGAIPVINQEINALQEEVNSLIKVGNVEYYGEIQDIKISENKHRLTSTKMLEHTPNSYSGTLSNQSMAVFNNKYFCFNDTSNASTPFCVVIDMSDNSIIEAVMEHPSVIGASHVNNACFTDKYYDPNDEYPLMLISRGDYPDGTAKGKEMYIFRLQQINSHFVFTHIKTITTEKYYVPSWEYDAKRGMIWGHLCQGGDWRWGNSGYRKFNNAGLYFIPYNNPQYVCLESNDVAAVNATITVTFIGNSEETYTVDVSAGERVKCVIPYTSNVGGYAYIKANQSAEAFSGQYTVYECDVNGDNKIEIDYRCIIAGFEVPDITTSDPIIIPESKMTNPVKIDSCIYQGGCCFNGKVFLPIQNYNTINGQEASYKGHCCVVINPLSGRIETQIPTDTIENEGCAIYNGALYISSHVGNAVGDNVSFRIFKYEF